MRALFGLENFTLNLCCLLFTINSGNESAPNFQYYGADNSPIVNFIRIAVIGADSAFSAGTEFSTVLAQQREPAPASLEASGPRGPRRPSARAGARRARMHAQFTISYGGSSIDASGLLLQGLPQNICACFIIDPQLSLFGGQSLIWLVFTVVIRFGYL